MKPLILGREHIDATGAVDIEEVLGQLGDVLAALGYPAPYRGGADPSALQFKPFYVYDDAGTSRFFSPPIAGEDPTDLLAAPGGALTATSGYTEYTFGTGTSTGVSITYPLLIRGTVASVGSGTCTITGHEVLSSIPAIAPTGSPSEPTLADPITVAFTFGSAGTGSYTPDVSVGDLVYASRADKGLDGGGALWQLVDSNSLPSGLEGLGSYQVHASGVSRYLLVNGTNTVSDDPSWASIASVLTTLDGYDVTKDQDLIHFAGEDPSWDDYTGGGSGDLDCDAVKECITGDDDFFCQTVADCFGDVGDGSFPPGSPGDKVTEIIKSIIYGDEFNTYLGDLIFKIIKQIPPVPKVDVDVVKKISGVKLEYDGDTCIKATVLYDRVNLNVQGATDSASNIEVPSEPLCGTLCQEE